MVAGSTSNFKIYSSAPNIQVEIFLRNEERKTGRKAKRREGGKDGTTEGGKEGRKEGRKEGTRGSGQSRRGCKRWGEEEGAPPLGQQREEKSKEMKGTTRASSRTNKEGAQKTFPSSFHLFPPSPHLSLLSLPILSFVALRIPSAHFRSHPRTYLLDVLGGDIFTLSQLEDVLLTVNDLPLRLREWSRRILDRSRR